MLLNLNIKNDPDHKARVYVKPDRVVTDVFGSRGAWWVVKNPEWVKRANEVVAMPNAADHPFWEQMRDVVGGPAAIGAERVAMVV